MSVTGVLNEVLAWVSDNFKILAVALVAGIQYLQLNKAALGLSDQQVVLLGLVLVILAATDPNRDHIDPAPAPEPSPQPSPVPGAPLEVALVSDTTP